MIPPGSKKVAVLAMIALSGVVGAAGSAFLILRYRAPAMPAPSTTVTEVRPTPDVVVAIHGLARLETESFHIERVIDLSDKQTHLFGLVQSKDAILLLAVGDVVAGIDLDEVAPGDVDVDWRARTARVRLPAPRVFSSTLDEAATRVYSRSTDMLAERHEDLEDRARVEAVRSMEKAAVEHGILDRAKKDGERAVTSLLKSIGFDEVTIDWKASS